VVEFQDNKIKIIFNRFSFKISEVRTLAEIIAKMLSIKRRIIILDHYQLLMEVALNIINQQN
jgi:hypothetical protein